MSDRKKHLFSEFPPVTTEEWEQVIKEDLKGADYKKKLSWHTGEGIETLPFYRKEDLQTTHVSIIPGLMDTGSHWEVRQRVFEQDVNKANQTARQAIARGADALQFNVKVRYTDGMLGSDLAGTALQNQSAFSELIKDIDIQHISLHFNAGMVTPAVIALMLNECRDKDIEPSNVQSTFLFDPYAFTISNGQLPKKEKDFIEDARQLVVIRQKEWPGLKPLGVDAGIYHQAGASMAQELGFALATGSEYLAKLTESGLSVEEIIPAIHFNFSIGSSYFLEIAKFRAARILWARVLEAYRNEQRSGSTAKNSEDQDQNKNSDSSSKRKVKWTGNQAMYVHAESSRWNKTVFDPYTNVLRSTTEGMSAAIAGCDAITLNPFDLAFREPDEFSRRIARNTQIILQEEAYLNKVKDPSAGSYYIEILTGKIAEAAWNCFQEVERQGGMLQSMMDGYIQTAVEKSRQKQEQAIATRKRIFLGTNQYPNPGDGKSAKPNADRGAYPTVSLTETDHEVNISRSSIVPSLAKAFKKGSTLGDIVPELFNITKHDIRPIRTWRGPQAFEELRLATQNHKRTPVVLTIPIGDRKMRKARSAFAANLFGCAGYDIKDPIGYDSVDDAVRAVEEEQPDLVVICSSDHEYKQLVPEMVKQFQSMKQQPIVVLAGYPEKEEDEKRYREAGIDEFIHAKSNVLKTLKSFHKKLGIMERG